MMLRDPISVIVDDPDEVVDSWAVLHKCEDCVVVYLNLKKKHASLMYWGPEVYVSSAKVELQGIENTMSFGEVSRYEAYITFLNRDKVVGAINGQREHDISK